MIKFEYGPEFQENMLSIMLDDISFAMKCISYIDPSHLHSDTHKWLFSLIQKSLSERNTVPSFVEVEDNLKTEDRSKRRLYTKFAKKIFDAPIKSKDYIKEKLTQFAKKTAFVKLFAESQVLYNLGKTEESYEYVMESINKIYSVSFESDQVVTTESFESLRQEIVAQKSISIDRIPTGIDSLDLILGGGLSKFNGELGIILGLPKSAKSIGLIHMGFSCLTSLRGRIAHFQLEGPTAQTVNRYQSRLTGVPANKIDRNMLEDVELKRLEAIGSKYKDRLCIVPFNSHWEYTTADIDAKIVELDREGRKPDLVIVDYADLVKPRKSTGEVRHDQTSVFRDLKSMAMRHKVAMWTGSQAQRPKEDPNKEWILRSSNVSEAYEKIRIADFVCTLNQTPFEKDAGILRIYADICRANASDVMIRTFCDFSRMIFSYKKCVDLMPHDMMIAASWKMKARRR